MTNCWDKENFFVNNGLEPIDITDEEFLELNKKEEKIPLFIWEQNILNEAIERWGIEPQLRMLQEECGELIAVINHFCRGREDWDKVCEEVSDVKILIDQIALVEENNKLMNEFRSVKMKRLEERLNK